MKSEDIRPYDWMRILVGEVPNSYFIELVIRMAFIYLVLTVAMRLMGKRMASQLGRNELAALVALAGATGLPIMAPNRGLLPVIVVAAVIVGSQRLFSWLSYRFQTFEAITQGSFSGLVEDAVMDIGAMQTARVTRSRLMAQLRVAGLVHLGEVKRLYIEANGSFTLVKAETPIPGLSILPDRDDELMAAQQKADHQLVCNNCGNPATAPEPTSACGKCGDQNWVKAVAVQG